MSRKTPDLDYWFASISDDRPRSSSADFFWKDFIQSLKDYASTALNRDNGSYCSVEEITGSSVAVGSGLLSFRALLDLPSASLVYWFLGGPLPNRADNNLKVLSSGRLSISRMDGVYHVKSTPPIAGKYFANLSDESLRSWDFPDRFARFIVERFVLHREELLSQLASLEV